jgi:hypothetical protein
MMLYLKHLSAWCNHNGISGLSWDRPGIKGEGIDPSNV